MAKNLNFGNVTIKGFVNLAAENRVVIGTGSYTNQSGERVFKDSITVFYHDAFDGQKPAKGDFVQVNGDLHVSPRKDQPEVLQATINVRFANQLTKLEQPKAKAAAAVHDDSDI